MAAKMVSVCEVRITTDDQITFRLKVDTNSKKQLDDMSRENKVQCVEIIESASGNEQLFISRR